MKANAASNSFTEAARQDNLNHIRAGKLDSGQKILYGEIVEQRIAVNERGFNTLQVRIDFAEAGRGSIQGKGIESTWYGMGYPPEVIALIYGSDLVGMRCKLIYNTIEPSSGVVEIAHNKYFQGDLDEAAEPAKVGGRILAPAGSVV